MTLINNVIKRCPYVKISFLDKVSVWIAFAIKRHQKQI